jgi:hypothetical protein
VATVDLVPPLRAAGVFGAAALPVPDLAFTGFLTPVLIALAWVALARCAPFGLAGVAGLLAALGLEAARAAVFGRAGLVVGFTVDGLG